MVVVRYVLPAAIFVAGLALLLFSGSTSALHVFFMAFGAALSVLLLNFLFRLGAKGDEDRDREEAAREYFARHGRWPGE